MQLDIFEHSRDTMLRNDALQALQQRNPAAVRAAAQRLAAEYPGDRSLPDLERLADVLESAVPLAFDAPAAAAQALQLLRDQIAPASQRLLGNIDGSTWLKPLWQQMARRAATLDFRADQPDCHAASLWLLAGEPASAADAVERIASWRRIPAPLQWMCEARWQLQGLDASWGLLAELAWLAPARFDALAQRRADPLLQRLRRQFDQCFEGNGDTTDLAWFPAWALIEKPALAPLLGQAQPGLQNEPERGMRLLLDLLHLERLGRQRDLIEQRRRLRDLHQGLFAAYMATR
jgi:hypothetical protein